MNFAVALPVGIAAGFLATAVIALHERRQRRPQALATEPAPTTQELRLAFGWPELPAARPSAHPTNPLPFPIIVDAEPWAEELADGDD